MARIDELLSEYSDSHKDPANKLLHWVCVPLIVFSLLGIICSIDNPAVFNRVPVPLGWSTLVIFLAMIYYLVLSPRLALGVFFILMLMFGLINWLERSGVLVWLVSVVIFILAWAGQFVGHKLEGKKPSFFKDLQFLLIGPLWLLSFVYRRLGITY